MQQLTASEKETIKRTTGWSDKIVNYISSFEEAQIYIKAHLQEASVGGKPALIRRDINWRAFNCRKEWLKTKLADYDKWKDYNNADLIGEGYPPRDENGDPYELHHIGQQPNSPFAELTWQEHMGDGNNTILHQMGEYSTIDRQAFDKEKSQYWQDRYHMFTPEQIDQIYG